MDNVFQKDYNDEYDSKTTLSVDFNQMIDSLPESSRRGLAKYIAQHQFIIDFISVITASVMIVAGVVFMALGISGTINLDMTIGELSVKMVNAMPGAFLCVLGVVLFFLLRHGK